MKEIEWRVPGSKPITNSTVIKKLVFYGGGGQRQPFNPFIDSLKKENGVDLWNERD